MKNSIVKVLAIAIFIITLPLMPIEVLFGYSGNIFSRIKQNFDVIMFSVSLVQLK